jgi:hypothetical protein
MRDVRSAALLKALSGHSTRGCHPPQVYSTTGVGDEHALPCCLRLEVVERQTVLTALSESLISSMP